jgi:hypothetical protein
MIAVPVRPIVTIYNFTTAHDPRVQLTHLACALDQTLNLTGRIGFMHKHALRTRLVRG